jgi:hypothetical protein
MASIRVKEHKSYEDLMNLQNYSKMCEDHAINFMPYIDELKAIKKETGSLRLKKKKTLVKTTYGFLKESDDETDKKLHKALKALKCNLKV